MLNTHKKKQETQKNKIPSEKATFLYSMFHKTYIMFGFGWVGDSLFICLF